MKSEAELLLAKINIKKEAGARSTLAAMTPESLGLALAVLMKTREDSDFDTIMLILGSTVWRKDGKGAKVSPEHKLKWVLRYITDAPVFGGPETEKMKDDSLKAGIEKLMDFGEGKGFGYGAKGNSKFILSLKSFLETNGLTHQ